ncbi:MAG TPA: hypothetical protein DEP53_05660, partial [Bacteroidetes bacterium]|nr:hypothetical protein [Bacteroidota bacterium]
MCRRACIIVVVLLTALRVFCGEKAHLIVAADGSGNYRTIQEALNSIPGNNTKKVIILIRNGTYHEKLFIERSFVTLVGESRDSTKIVYCIEPATLHSAGWLAWNVVPALYAEFNCFGAGAATNGRVPWSRQLSTAEAAQYSLMNIFAKSATTSNLVLYDWKPTQAGPGDDLPLMTAVQTNLSNNLPGEVLLSQNYPNPFNGNTTITFQLQAFGRVVLTLYDLLGREIQELVSREFPAGKHSILLNTSGLPSGVYLYRLVTGNE